MNDSSEDSPQPGTVGQCDKEGRTLTESWSKEQSGTDSGRKPGTPPTAKHMSAEDAGDDTLDVAAAEPLDGAQAGTLVALAREGEGKAACWERLRKEARAVGLKRGQGPGTAYEWATREVERLFPPKLPESEPIVEPEPVVEPDPESAAPTIVDIPPPPADQGVPGLGDIPEVWGELPANASLQVEISWVSANRLRVRDGSGVDLSRALSPAPSYAALSWLETSILFPSKFADISVKATQHQEDEREAVRREKMAIEEIRGLLAEMLEE